MKQFRTALLFVGALTTVCTANARADELALNNGERLLGSFKNMQDGTINFESETFGALTLPMAKVKSLSVDTPREAHLASGTVVIISSFNADTETGMLARPDATDPVTVRLHEIKAISPPPQPRIAFSGDISSGLVDTHGSSSSTKANLAAGLIIRTERQRLTLDTRWFYGREKSDDRRPGKGRRYVETDKNYSAGVRYDYFLSKKLYTYLGSRYKRDAVADLKYRLINSTGLGYQWVETPTLKFSTDAGIAQYKEKYVSRVNNPLYVPGGPQPKTLRKTRRVDDLAWQAGTSLDWRLNSRLALLSQARYTQSVENSRDYYLSTETELRLFLTRSFYSNLKTIFEYDNTPGADSTSTETKHIFGLGWSF